MSLSDSRKSRDPSRQPKLMDATVPSDDERQPILERNPETYTYAPNVAYIRRPPKDYRVVSILATIFCFLPLGLFSIYYSLQVNNLYSRGDLTKANRASSKARLLAQLATITGCVLWFSGILALLYFGT